MATIVYLDPEDEITSAAMRIRHAPERRVALVVPFGSRVAVIGDLVTSRLYKDGLLSAHRTAAGLAAASLENGIDERSLRQGYGPVVERFRRDNRYATVVFLLHRATRGAS